MFDQNNFFFLLFLASKTYYRDKIINIWFFMYARVTHNHKHVRELLDCKIIKWYRQFYFFFDVVIYNEGKKNCSKVTGL